jgi:hypothetical protein
MVRAVVTRPTLRIPRRASDVETATLRYVLFGLLPAWFVPGVLDWLQHRRTDIQHTSGSRESLIHSLMMAEVGAPITLALLCEINPLVLLIIAGAITAHEATALWDLRTAQDGGREVTPWEQHIHSFMESLPFMATGALTCLHWEQLRILASGAGSRDAWRLRWKRHPLPGAYLGSFGAAIVGLIAVPYGEELLRCVRTARQVAARTDPPEA